MMEDIPNVIDALVNIAIEQSLHEISDAVYDDVGKTLYKKYKCYFHNCLEHPDYLVDVLQQIFGDGYISIVNSINKKLQEYSYQKPIKEFLLELYK